MSKRSTSRSALLTSNAIAAAEQPGSDPLRDRFMLEDEVAAITGLSRTTRWREARKGSFPRPRTLSAGRIGWLASEVRAWMAARAATPQHQEARHAVAS